MNECGTFFIRLHKMLQLEMGGMLWISVPEGSDKEHRLIAALVLLACSRGVFIAFDYTMMTLPGPLQCAINLMRESGCKLYTSFWKKV